MNSASSNVHVEIDDSRAAGPVARVTIDNERRLNCMTSAQTCRLEAAFKNLSKDETLRAIVLTGAGNRAFIGGADLNELGKFDREGVRTFITAMHHACKAIRDCPVPVIGRINGFTLGAGLEIAASCDMRVATDTAVLGMPEVKMGIPSVIEAALLPGLIGWGKTRELLLTGDNISAQEALRIGLVERVVAAEQLDAAVEDWLSGILASAPLAVRTQKALIDRWQRSSLEEGVLAGIDAIADAYPTGEPTLRIAGFFAHKAKK